MDRSAVILAGGRGRRMGGVNKALLSLGSEAFIDRQIRVCSDWTDDVIVVCNDEEFGWKLRERYAVRTVADRYRGEGPLAGFQAGVSAARHSCAWLLGCDQPHASAEAASLLHARLLRDGASAALPMRHGRPQPLHALYLKETAQIAEDLLRHGERRLLALLERMTWTGLGGAEFAQAGILDDFADDIDTPEDYQHLVLGRRPR